MKITLKDGSILEIDKPMSAIEIAALISGNLARRAACAKVNGEIKDLRDEISGGCTLEILTFDDEEGKLAFRHTAAHILAQAVKNIFPTSKLAIGPAISNGFYYDFDFKTPITLEDLVRIEAEMKKIVKADLPIVRQVVTKRDALKKMREFGESYKIELINSLPPKTPITIYSQGDFTDLCAGPHLMSTGKVNAFKLTSLTGAYWKGDVNNKMLSRIYGTAFEKKSDLNDYLVMVEEAKKRDHNKIGRELNFFMTDENIGQGLPLLMPKGAKVLQILQRFVEDEEERRGYILTKTPILAKNNLYKLSGHWSHYKDKMFILGDESADEVFALRPMTCPFQFTIYKNGLKSYRDLPIRYAETSTLFRNEASGEMHGLIRVRQFTISEGHIVCTPEQLKQEFNNVIDLINYMLNALGLKDSVYYRFSKGDITDTKKFIDAPEAWIKTEAVMKEILDDLGIQYTEAQGEAAFYGPKLDIQSRNVYGKEDTIITVQIDFLLAERFEMYYIDENGDKKFPYIIHRTSIGCYERTLAMLIEKYAGALPLWINPVQVKVLSLTDRTIGKCQEVTNRLLSAGIRAESDIRNEKIGYKIREAQLNKVNYMLIIGDKEAEAGAVSVRSRQGGDLGQMTTEEFIERINKEIREKTL
ncbi:MAG: threonine--tRNA ligase [Christensenellales bacterium]|jgi:threonyl-tRNA synthetase